MLCFIQKERELLLIYKKRGLGGGKISAPGGKIEPGETPLQAVFRETWEEVGLVPHAPKAGGELSFQFADGYRLHCTVFLANGCDGTPIETAEARPFWNSLDTLPYDKMWSDDRDWLPMLLECRPFRGFYVFDGDKMLRRKMLNDEC